jgi:hypothetical protein
MVGILLRYGSWSGRPGAANTGAGRPLLKGGAARAAGLPLENWPGRVPLGRADKRQSSSEQAVPAESVNGSLAAPKLATRRPVPGFLDRILRHELRARLPLSGLPEPRTSLSIPDALLPWW